jgi:hypothetical protein
MLVISRNGKATVITGWQAWVVSALLGIVAAVVLIPLAALLLGLSLTIAAFVLLVVPLAVAIAVLTTWLRALWGRPG